MRLFFADSNFWIALLNPRDALHLKATELSKSLSGDRIVTSEMVLTELLNDYGKRGHTDCSSFRIMDRDGITQALTYDRHFKQAGFQALLRDSI